MVLTNATISQRRPSPAKQPGERIDDSIELPQLTQDASEVLYEASGVFPLDLFPDKVIVRINHIDVVHGVFFWSGSTQRLQIIDIREISVHYNPFFATLQIIPIALPQDISIEVKFLWRHQAMRAKRIITGLLECHQQQVDLSSYSKGDLVAHVEEIGRTKNP